MKNSKGYLFQFNFSQNKQKINKDKIINSNTIAVKDSILFIIRYL